MTKDTQRPELGPGAVGDPEHPELTTEELVAEKNRRSHKKSEKEEGNSDG